jgi:lipid II:glycine glycyltransferase (peptidoglycan interpeptide bridge formation enzyme)
MSLLECRNETEAPPSSGEPKVAHCIEPLKDRRWDEFVQRHPRASVFHSSAWLGALSRTYGYKPIAYTTSPAGQKLESGMVLCRVESWLTGRRLVSLPFSDHCDPLVDTPEDLAAITAALERESRCGRWRYIEMRPLQRCEIVTSLQHATVPYTFHQLDLGPEIDTLFRNFHKDSIQRKIRRADREGLRHRQGCTEELLDYFYKLHTITRKRHRRPPQPRKWFVNLMDGFGSALNIRVAFKDDRPLAAVLTICHRDTLVYKYGGSDSRFNNLGGMHLLLWRAIQEAKTSGLHFFDFGRTEAGQQGLITFKKRWGATQSTLIYSRYGLSDNVTHMFESSAANWQARMAKYLLARMQPGVLSFAGRVLYRHVG